MRNNTRILPARKLTGTRCRCRACGELFASVYAFDRHRRGEYHARYCLTAEQLTAADWMRDARGFWRTPKKGHGPVVRAQISGDRHDPATWVRVAA